MGTEGTQQEIRVLFVCFKTSDIAFCYTNSSVLVDMEKLMVQDWVE